MIDNQKTDPHLDRSNGFDCFGACAIVERHVVMRDEQLLPTACGGALVMAGDLGFAIAVSSTVAGDRMAAAVSGLASVR
jgi:hypothetical protein